MIKRQFPWIVLFAVLIAMDLRADNTSTPVKPHTFAPGGTIKSSEVNADFDTIYTGLANIGTANLLANAITTVKIVDAAVTTAKLDATAQAKLIVTGTVIDYIGVSAPTGWVRGNGKTIGNATSGASERANADTVDLFTLLYASMLDAQAPVSGGRSGNAATDFSNGKTITLPDLEGRSIFGNDNMGGAAAARISVAGGNFDGSVQGSNGGLQNHTLITGELPVHSHPVNSVSHLHGMHQINIATGGGAPNAALSPSNLDPAAPNAMDAANGAANPTGNTGSGTAHTVLPPAYILYKIIKL